MRPIIKLLRSPIFIFAKVLRFNVFYFYFNGFLYLYGPKKALLDGVHIP